MLEYQSNWDNIPLPNTEHKTTKKTSLTLFFLYFSLLCFAAMSLYLFVNHYFKNNYISSDNIFFSNTLMTNYESGIKRPIEFNIKNNNKVDLRDVQLIVEYESGRKQNGEYNMVLEKFEFGDLKYGENVATSTDLLFTGKEGDQRGITFNINYKMQNNTIFKKNFDNKIMISSSLLDMIINTNIEEEVVPFDYVEIEAEVKNISSKNWDGGKMQIQTPYSFVMNQEDGKKDVVIDLKNIEMPKISVGDSFKYKLSGYFDGKNIGDNIFRVSVTDKTNVNALLVEDVLNIKTAETPITYKINFKKDLSDIYEPEINIPYELGVTLENRSDYAYDNLYIKIDYDKSSFVFDSKKNADLLRINPLESKELKSNITLKQEENRFNIEIYGNKKGSKQKVLLLSEYYVVKAK